ncbi:MAG: ClpX C4-type zinc finger, partial [Labilithrix sp.]|nr:ClpX C4-type zinc finger [Labilithrix sp.]
MSTVGGTGAGVARCSACGRGPAQVKRLLTARTPAVELVICNRCVSECEQAIADAPTRI